MIVFNFYRFAMLTLFQKLKCTWTGANLVLLL